jgi:hypothetical protein
MIAVKKAIGITLLYLTNRLSTWVCRGIRTKEIMLTYVALTVARVHLDQLKDSKCSLCFCRASTVWSILMMDSMFAIKERMSFLLKPVHGLMLIRRSVQVLMPTDLKQSSLDPVIQGGLNQPRILILRAINHIAS